MSYLLWAALAALPVARASDPVCREPLTVRMKSGLRSLFPEGSRRERAVFWLPRQQARYWKEVWNSPYGSRLVLAPRNAGDGISWQNIAFALADPYVGPATILSETLKTRYSLSIPAGLGGSVGIYLARDHLARSALSENETVVPGASYISDLEQAGVLSVAAEKGPLELWLQTPDSSLLKRQLSQHVEVLRDWKKRDQNSFVLPRINTYFREGVFKNAAQAHELNRLALSVFPKNFCPSAPRCSGQDSEEWSKTLERWNEALSLHPEFGKLPPATRALFLTIFDPDLSISGASLNPLEAIYSDSDLLLRSSGVVPVQANDPLRTLQPLFPYLDSASMVKLGYETLKNPGALTRKAERWKSRFPSGDIPNFAKRPDMPGLLQAGEVFDQDGSGKSPLRLEDELSVWELIWTDRRFADLRELAIKNPAQNELGVLSAALNRIRDTNVLYALGRRDRRPSDGELCQMIGRKSGGPIVDVMATQVFALVEGLSTSALLSATEQEACSVELAELVFTALVREASFSSLQQQKELNAEILRKLAAVQGQCRSSSRRCGP